MEREYALTDLLRRPDVTYATLLTLPGAGTPVADPQVAEQVEIATKYAGYIDRQHDEIARHLAQETRAAAAGPRLRRRARTVDRGAAEARRRPAGNDRTGRAHLRHHAGGDLAAARASEAAALRPARGARERRIAAGPRIAAVAAQDDALARGIAALGVALTRRSRAS